MDQKAMEYSRNIDEEVSALNIREQESRHQHEKLLAMKNGQIA